MLIEVTQQDIDKGKRDSPCRCPVALAVQRTTGLPNGDIRVEQDGPFDPCHVKIGGHKHAMSREADQFIMRFDAGQPVEPLTITVNDTGYAVMMAT